MAAVKLAPRLRILRSLEKEPHKYPHIRRYTMAITFAILYAIPLLGLARFDLWDGRHMAAGARTNFVYGFGAVFLSVVIFYLFTFVLNGVVGRLFCGFGCPVGELSRKSDSAEIARKTGENRLRAEGLAVLFAFGLAAGGFLWFVDPRVFIEGSLKAILRASGGLVAATAAVYALGRFARWGFCRGYCPIGLYYSVVQTAHAFGIHYNEIESICKGCDYCEQACPVGLDPKDLRKPQNDVIGIAIEGLPQSNHCLTCGECVRACETVFVHKPDLIPPLSLSRKADARRPDGEKNPPKARAKPSASADAA
ncbi:MAG: 4Fe-4S dicluster domain-containing protein [Polyangiaceae bacterium]